MLVERQWGVAEAEVGVRVGVEAALAMLALLTATEEGVQVWHTTSATLPTLSDLPFLLCTPVHL